MTHAMQGKAPAAAPAGDLEKAATLLLAMGRDSATRILKQLDRNEVQSLLQAAARLGAVETFRAQSIIDEFSEGLKQQSGGVACDMSVIESLAQGALDPMEAVETMSAIRRGGRKDVIGALKMMTPPQLVQLLEQENPQAAAVILDRLDADSAARALETAPPRQRAEWLARMPGGRVVAPNVIMLIEEGLARSMEAAAGAPSLEDHAPPRIATIVNKFEPEEIDATLAELEERCPGRASAVRALIFKFDDIVLLSQPARAVLFDKVSAEQVVLALRGIVDPLKESILSAMGQRARRMVEAELTGAANIPPADISRARRAIADLTLQLAEQGLLELPQPQGGEAQEGAPA